MIFVLAIDHRNSLRRWYTAVTGARAADQPALRAAKVVVADGLLAALRAETTLVGRAALLVDEEYGQDAIRLVRANRGGRDRRPGRAQWSAGVFIRAR